VYAQVHDLAGGTWGAVAYEAQAIVFGAMKRIGPRSILTFLDSLRLAANLDIGIGQRRMRAGAGEDRGAD